MCKKKHRTLFVNNRSTILSWGRVTILLNGVRRGSEVLKLSEGRATTSWPTLFLILVAPPPPPLNNDRSLTEALCKMGNLAVSKCVTKVYQAARDGSSYLEDLLIRLKTTEQRKTALETKTKDGSHFVTPLIIAAHNGHLNSVKILLSYKADIEARGTLKIGDEV